MKILITKDIVNGPNNGKLYRIKAEGEDWITNGDWALKESGCILQQEIEPPIDSDATLQTMLEQMSRAEYTDDPDFSVAVHPLYAPIIAQMNDLDNIRVCVATKTLPIIFLDIDKKQPVGFLMPCVSEEDAKELYKAKSKQELMLILNNYKAYVEKHDLIPVEYKIIGNSETCGIFVPRNMTNSQIKKMIDNTVKQHGDRWNGRFSRRPEKKDKLVEKVVNYMSKLDIQEIQKRALAAQDRAMEKEV